jgi:hypothetical protein
VGRVEEAYRMTDTDTEPTNRAEPGEAPEPEASARDETRSQDDSGDAGRIVELTAEVERLRSELEIIRAEGQAPPSPRDVLLRISMWLITVSMVLLLGWLFGADSRPMAALIFVIVIGVVTVAMVLLTKGK